MITKNHRTGEGQIRLERAPPGFVLVSDGWGGMETSIHFDYCEDHGDVIGFYLEGDKLVSEIFVDEKFRTSRVASALRAIEHNQIEVEP